MFNQLSPASSTWQGIPSRIFIAGLIIGLTSMTARAEGVAPTAIIEIAGDIIAAEDVSAIAKVGGLLVIGADEAIGEQKNKNFIQVLEPDGDNRFVQQRDILLFEGAEKEEMDIEGIAAVGDVVYVIGSHSKKRTKVKADKSYKKNRKTFHGAKVKPEPGRARLYKLTLAPDGSMVEGTKEQQELQSVIDGDPVLGPFSRIPSKENGVDIEGLAAKDGWLYAGLRGPVLRDGYVPVMRFKFEDPAGTYKLRYVKLDGRGIRSMERVSDGFLIVAGPVGGGPGTFQVHHWDGKDLIFGEGRDPNKVGKSQLLQDLLVPDGAKAEGLTVLDETADHYEILIVFDGIKDPIAQRYRVVKP